MSGFKMLVDGQLVASDETYDVFNPSTGAPFAKAPHAHEEVAVQAVNAAAIAFRTWQSTAVSDRKSAMQSVLDVLTANADELAELLVQEQGKPLASAKGELAGCMFLLKKAIAIETPAEVYTDTKERRVEVRRKPIGVIACITPWNFPLFCSVQKWAPAIVCKLLERALTLPLPMLAMVVAPAARAALTVAASLAHTPVLTITVQKWGTLLCTNPLPSHRLLGFGSLNWSRTACLVVCLMSSAAMTRVTSMSGLF